MTISKEDLLQVAQQVLGHHATHDSQAGVLGFGKFLWHLNAAVWEAVKSFQSAASQVEKLARKEAAAPALSTSVRGAGKDIRVGLLGLTEAVKRLK